jgi:hypothetical protein
MLSRAERVICARLRPEKAEAPNRRGAFADTLSAGYKARLPSNSRLRPTAKWCQRSEVPLQHKGWTVVRRTGESNPSGCFQPSNAWQAYPVPTPGVSSEASRAKSGFWGDE